MLVRFGWNQLTDGIMLRLLSFPQGNKHVLLGVRPFHARWAWVASMRAGLSLRAARYSSRAEDYSMARKRTRVTGTWPAEKAKRNAIIKEFTIEPRREKVPRAWRFLKFVSIFWILKFSLGLLTHARTVRILGNLGTPGVFFKPVSSVASLVQLRSTKVARS